MVADSETVAPWRIQGTYLEVCNCDPICPCRRIDGISGGRSTYGYCAGALSWQITNGAVHGLDLASLCAVLVSWYSDDEPGSPWSWVLHVDERGDEPRRAALADVFSGRLGGTPLSQFPWAFKSSNLLAVVPSQIEIEHTPAAAGSKRDQPCRCGLPVHSKPRARCRASSPATIDRAARSSPNSWKSTTNTSSSPTRDAAATRRASTTQPHSRRWTGSHRGHRGSVESRQQ